jgi:N-acyl-D-amino-acid deacylase
LSYDLVIKGGKIINGTGNPWFYGDVAVQDNKLSVVGRLDELDASYVIDAEGMVVTPGFVDPHSHSDVLTLFYREMESAVMQGITTVVGGQCGSSLAPINPEMREELEIEYSKILPPGVELKLTWTTFDDYLTLEEKDRLGVNMAHLVGHGAIRVAAMGQKARAPTSEEMEKMKSLTIEAMMAGAYGISSGLIYPPGIFAKTDELIKVAKIASEYGGVYDTHLRGEGSTLFESLKEAISIGEKAGIPVQISHHKAASKSVWGKSMETLRMLEEARAKGIDVTVDQYPYRAGATSLSTCLPPWAQDGGMSDLLKRLEDPELREKMKKDIDEGIPGWENFAGELGWNNIMVSSVNSEDRKVYEEKNLEEIREMRGDPDTHTTLFDLILEEEGAVGMIIFAMKEDDVRRIMKHPLQMVGTDSSASATEGYMSSGKPHPRGYGTYPKILGRYVKKHRVLRLEEAVRKMTSFPSQRFGILDRGLLMPGMWADIVVFDPKKIIDKATYQNPHQYPDGIEYVVVNGQVSVEQGKNTGVLAGRTLRKTV